MNRITTLLAGTIVAAGAATFAFAAQDDGHGHSHGEGETTTITGELIDTACYVASDGGAKGEGHAECAQQCLASGIPGAVLPEGGGPILYLTTNPKPLAQYAGQTIKVEGVKHEDMQAIDVKKVSVKQADGSFKEVKLDDYHHKMEGGEDAVSEDAAKDDDHAGHAH